MMGEGGDAVDLSKIIELPDESDDTGMTSEQWEKARNKAEAERMAKEMQARLQKQRDAGGGSKPVVDEDFTHKPYPTGGKSSASGRK